MKTHNLMKKTLLAVVICALAFVTFAQEKDIKGQLDKPLTSPIPMDPNVRVGKLENGLTYYIRKNDKPEDKIEFRLAVNAGSILENEDQKGLAHFVEHMAFNGSKNFQKNELVNYLQSIGVEFGADLNAYTSFDETVYMLPIPTGDPEVLDQGLKVLEDWAGGLEFSPEEIDKERGVVIEEWRLGQGADQRMRDKWFPIMFKDSRYAERLPIGEKEIIENADYETIKSFYKTWYRPNLMAIVAVGDLDPDAMEKEIKTRFGKLKNPKKPQERKVFDVPSHEDTYVAIEQDKEASFTMVRVVYKMDDEDGSKELKDLRKSLTYSLFNNMINQRLNELRQSATPPFVFGSTGYGSLVRTKNNYSSFAMVGEDGIMNGLEALVTENERVKRFGFTEGELKRAKARLLNSLEQEMKEQDKTESGRLAMEYVNSFLETDPIISPYFTYEFAKKQFESIKVAEINAYAPKWIKDSDRVVVITGPERDNPDVTKESVLATLKDVGSMELEPYADEMSDSELLAEKPKKGSVASEKVIENVDITELTLSNGVKVVLKATDYKNDEILMSASSDGGHSLYDDDNYENATYSSSIVSESGVADFSKTDLDKLFAGKTVRVSPFVGTYSEGFSGSAAPKDLETMMQMIYLYFTSPRKDAASFESFKTRNTMLYGNLMSNPAYYFQNEMIKILSQYNKRVGFPTAEELAKIDLDKSFAIYKERFADPANFTFFFVGNFKVEEIKPLLETYLASIPSVKREETWKDLGIRPPKGKYTKVINKGTDPKSQVSINYKGEADYSKEENYILSSLGEVVTNRLIDLIREEKSGVYGVGANGYISERPYENYTFSISFPCGPENMEELKQAVYDEIELIKKEGVTEEDLKEIKESQKINRKESLKENRYWLNSLSSYYSYNRDLADFYEYEKLIEELKPKDLQEAAKKYLVKGNLIEIVLMPEE
ncbi:M16 family metallopeptidase [Marinoscillum pacificum]|uniref:M16 family metallopeptidase n=1 Tax=Marinoscillum pacificum TaxID=392723 RepID=UPI002157B10E|nr:insulinase family protein [Marinoscillum pacificum]